MVATSASRAEGHQFDLGQASSRATARGFARSCSWHPRARRLPIQRERQGISGLVAEHIAAIDATRFDSRLMRFRGPLIVINIPPPGLEPGSGPSILTSETNADSAHGFSSAAGAPPLPPERVR